MMNQAKALKRIQCIKDKYDADQLSCELYGTKENLASDDLREVYIAAWVNYSDCIDEGMEEERARMEMLNLLRNQIGF